LVASAIILASSSAHGAEVGLGVGPASEVGAGVVADVGAGVGAGVGASVGAGVVEVSDVDTCPPLQTCRTYTPNVYVEEDEADVAVAVLLDVPDVEVKVVL